MDKTIKAELPEIRLPSGYKPEEEADGGEVQALVKLKLKGDGTAEIISIDGAAYEGEPEVTEDDETAKDAEGGDTKPPQPTQSTEEGEPTGLADKIKKIRNSMR